jgi:two-component system OmpR family sensor kinase
MAELSERSVSVPKRLVATAVALTVVMIAEIVERATDVGTVQPVVFPDEFLVGVATTVPFLAGIAYAGYWLKHSEVARTRHKRVWWWTLTGGGASLVLNVAIMGAMPVASTLLAIAWLRWALAVGLGVGVAIGVTEARSIQSAMVAERTQLRAEHLELQRDLLDYLNSLLRHEVLNASNIISGYASLLKEEFDKDETGYEYSDTIHQRSEEITTVIDDVRVLLQAAEQDVPLEDVDLSTVLREEIERLSDIDEDVQVDASIPDAVYVHGDPLLRRVFGNVLSNAVRHNDSDPPRVSVDLTAEDGTVAATISDNGPGIPPEEVDTLFERPSRRTADHGLGLYIVAQLLDQYGGAIELVETGSSGTTFRITLPSDGQQSDDSAETRFPLFNRSLPE